MSAMRQRVGRAVVKRALELTKVPTPLTSDTDATRRLKMVRAVNAEYVQRVSALENDSNRGSFARLVAGLPFGADIGEYQIGLHANMLLERLSERQTGYAIDPRRIVVTSSPDDLFGARVHVEPDQSAIVIISHQIATLPGYLATLGAFAASRSPGGSGHVAARVASREASKYCVAALRAALICLVVDGLSGKSRPTDPARATTRAEARITMNTQTFVLAHEFGHALLGHRHAQRTAAHELDADRFALEVLSDFGVGDLHTRGVAARLALTASAFTEDRVKGGRSVGYPTLGQRFLQAAEVFGLDDGDRMLAEIGRAMVVEREIGALEADYWQALEDDSHGRPPVMKWFLLDAILNGDSPGTAIELSTEQLRCAPPVVAQSLAWLARQPLETGPPSWARNEIYEAARDQMQRDFADHRRDERSVLTASLLRGQLGHAVLGASPVGP